MKLTEAFKALDALNEDTFSVSDDGISKLAAFEQNDDLVDEISVIDPEAETEEDIKDSYVGKVILDCKVCHSKLYKDAEEIELDEEQTSANVGEECPYCYTTDGFDIIGQVATFGGKSEEEEAPVDDETKTDDNEDVDDTADDKVDENLTEGIDEAVATLERPMSALGGTLSNVMTAHKDELSQVQDRHSAIEFLDSIGPEVKNKRYLASIKDKVARIPDSRAAMFLYNIILKGDGMGRENESLNKSKSIKEDVEVIYQKGNKKIIKDGYGYAIDDGINANRFYVTDDGEPKFDDGCSSKFWLNKVNSLIKAGKLTSRKNESKSINEGVISDNKEIQALWDDFFDKYDKVAWNISTAADKYKKQGLESQANKGKEYSKKLVNIYKTLEKACNNNSIETATEIKNEADKIIRMIASYINRMTNESKSINDNSFTESCNMSESIIDSIVKEFTSLFNLTEAEQQDLRKDLQNGRAEDWADFVAVELGIKKPSDIKHIKNNSVRQFFLHCNKEDYNKLENEFWADDLEESKSINEGFNDYDVFTQHCIEFYCDSHAADHEADEYCPDNPDAWNIRDLRFVPRAVEYYKQSDYYDPKDWELDESKSIKEDVNNVNVETDDSIVNVNTDDDGKVTVTTEPKVSDAEPNNEVIVPVTDETQATIENGVESVEDEFVDAEFDGFDEEAFDGLGESYLKNVYSNVDSYKTEKVTVNDSNVIVEGMIKFASGNEKKTSFMFEAKDCTKSGKYRFIGENQQLTRGKKAFTITGELKDKKFITESFNYNYKSKDTNGKSNRIYGTLKNRKG